MAATNGATIEKVPVYCYQCVAGPDLLKVIVKDGVAIGVEPNSDFAEQHPACGKVCVRAYGLIQKLYNPGRIRTPMRRTNPRKGRSEDPGWEPISWDEAFDILGGRLSTLRARGLVGEAGPGGRLATLRARGLVDEAGYPQQTVAFITGRVTPWFLGTITSFHSAWGPVD